jgi:hypothetical protein
MAVGILLVVAVVSLPVAIVWRHAFERLQRNPTPEVKAFFWKISALFILLNSSPPDRQ